MTEQQKFEEWASIYQMRPAGWAEACWNAWQARAAQDKSAELLEALEACVNYGSMTGDDWVMEKARAAICKARGE